jgi:DNA/RNA-binding domain of Phe-tRNA-synthetase-like protein
VAVVVHTDPETMLVFLAFRDKATQAVTVLTQVLIQVVEVVEQVEQVLAIRETMVEMAEPELHQI